ncbi:MAG: DUF1548 domain-containing protein [Parachlamydiales bacterium]|nr:DUF1548 domain-containing protein [Parachlamydiales bacterium]
MYILEKRNIFEMPLNIRHLAVDFTEQDGEIPSFDLSSSRLITALFINVCGKGITALPPSLKELHLIDSRLSLPEELPLGIEILDCSGSMIGRLPKMPRSVRILNLQKTDIVTFAQIPHFLGFVPNLLFSPVMQEHPLAKIYQGKYEINMQEMRRRARTDIDILNRYRQEYEAVDLARHIDQLSFLSRERKQQLHAFVHDYWNDPQQQTSREQFVLWVKGLMVEIQRKNLSVEMQQEIFRNLWQYQQKCKPTWIRGLIEEWKKLVGFQDLTEELLHCVEEFKLQMLNQIGSTREQSTQWHFLNILAMEHGKEIGIVSTPDAFLEALRTVPMDGPIIDLGLLQIQREALESYRQLAEAVYWKFKQQYSQSARELVSSVAMQVLEKLRISQDRSIVNAIGAQIAEEFSGEEIMQHFFDEDYNMQETAIAYILLKIGILKIKSI